MIVFPNLLELAVVKFIFSDYLTVGTAMFMTDAQLKTSVHHPFSCVIQ
jgi:hypothetical protein